MVWNMAIKIRLGIFCLLFAITPLLLANCQIDAHMLYETFKSYRAQVNTATRLEDLTSYFSGGFKQYYTEKLANPENRNKQTRFLTHYWDNLNTAKDIIIVYEYSAQCQQQNATLELLVILDQPGQSTRQVDLWKVKIHYTNEKSSWLIDSIEYEKSDSQRTFEEQQIIDNFAVIR